MCVMGSPGGKEIENGEDNIFQEIIKQHQG